MGNTYFTTDFVTSLFSEISWPSFNKGGFRPPGSLLHLALHPPGPGTNILSSFQPPRRRFPSKPLIPSVVRNSLRDPRDFPFAFLAPIFWETSPVLFLIFILRCSWVHLLFSVILTIFYALCFLTCSCISTGKTSVRDHRAWRLSEGSWDTGSQFGDWSHQRVEFQEGNLKISSTGSLFIFNIR